MTAINRRGVDKWVKVGNDKQRADLRACVFHEIWTFICTLTTKICTYFTNYDRFYAIWRFYGTRLMQNLDAVKLYLIPELLTVLLRTSLALEIE